MEDFKEEEEENVDRDSNDDDDDDDEGGDDGIATVLYPHLHGTRATCSCP